MPQKTLPNQDMAGALSMARSMLALAINRFKGSTMRSSSFVSIGIATIALGLAGAASAQTCSKDSDCGVGMACHSQTTTACSGGAAIACPPNSLCDPIPPTAPTCTETTTMTCSYRWLLPCNADADCGDGFLCQPMTRGECSGSSGTAGSGTVGSGSASSPVSTPAVPSGPPATGGTGGSSVPPAVVDAGAATTCVTTTSFPGTCQPKNTTCTSDSDCPALWTCKEGTLGVRGGAPITIVADAGVVTLPAPAADPATGTSTATATGTATQPKTCQSPYGSAVPGSVDGRGNEGPVRADGGLGTSGIPPYAGADAGTIAIGVPTQSTADAGATTKGGSGQVMTPGTTTNTGTQVSTQPGARTGGSGCSVASNGSTSAVWIALLGLLALAARRRKG